MIAPYCLLFIVQVPPAPHRTSSFSLTSPRLALSPHLTSPHLISSHLISSHLISPYLTSPDLTSPHLTSTPRHTTPHHTNLPLSLTLTFFYVQLRYTIPIFIYTFRIKYRLREQRTSINSVYTRGQIWLCIISSPSPSPSPSPSLSLPFSISIPLLSSLSTSRYPMRGSSVQSSLSVDEHTCL